MISFETKTSAVGEILSQLKKLYGKKAIPADIFCEITLRDGLVTFASPGAILSLNCVTKGTAKASLSLRLLHSVIDHHGMDLLRVEFFDESLHIGSVIVKAHTTFFKDDKVLRTIRLPHKYNSLDLMRLRNEGYTKEELDFNNVTDLIEAAENDLYDIIRSVGKKLNKYGITNYELKDFIVSKLNIKLERDKDDIRLLLDRGKYI